MDSRIATAARVAEIAPFHVMEVQTAARALEAAGRSVIHLEIGEPDFPTPGPVIEAAQRAIAAGDIYYTSALGLPRLRAAIAAHIFASSTLKTPPITTSPRTMATISSMSVKPRALIAAPESGSRARYCRPSRASRSSEP